MLYGMYQETDEERLLRVLDLLASKRIIQGLLEHSDDLVEVFALRLYRSDAHVTV